MVVAINPFRLSEKLEMIKLKQSQRSIVKLAFDGHVHKQYLGALALERLANEVRVLQHLEAARCPFVPRVLSYSLDSMTVVLTNCGHPVQLLSDEKVARLFELLRDFGVEHEDPCLRNITYRSTDGKFCLIDFEFATVIDMTRTMSSRIEETLDNLHELISHSI